MMSSYNIAKTYFYAGKLAGRKPEKEFNIFKKTSLIISDIAVELAVIGESHFVVMPDLEYFEVLVNKKLNYAIAEFETKAKNSYKFNIAAEKFDAEVEIVSEEIIKFTLKEYQDYYEFAPNAYTAYLVDVVADNVVIKTAHSYPEFGIVLKSKSIIKPKL